MALAAHAWWTGRTSILADRLQMLCSTYGCKDVPYLDALMALSEASGKGWWTAYRKRISAGALDLAELEAGSTTLRYHETLLVPGLFQTADYARALFRTPKLGFENIEDAVDFRLARQTVLTGERPPTVQAVIHEAALRMRFGGIDVMRAQLLHLVELARLPHVTIQVFPFAAEPYPAISGTFLHTSPEIGLLGTVVLEHPTGSTYLSDREHLTRYEALFNRLAEQALAPVDPATPPESHAAKDSLALIQHVLYAL
jgi:hypothetical protein